MRTTLTLEDDVAIKLKKLSQGGKFKDVVNRALRLGLQTMEQVETTQPYETTPCSGNPRISSLDNIAEVIAESEADNWR